MVEEYAQVENDEFINILCTLVQDRGETSSCHVDSSNMHTFYQHHPSEHRWTKDHLLKQVIGNSSQSVRTRRQLESDAEMCMFAFTKELHKFDLLDVRDMLKRKELISNNHLHLLLDWKLYGFSLRIQIQQSPHGIFINQAKYAQEILIKHGMTSCDSVGTPMATKHLDANLSGTPVDQTKYRSMVGALMYLTASRPDIVHATCYCARYQAKPAEKHLTAVKRIFRYLEDTIHMGLWYPKDTGFELTAFSDSNHVGCLDSRKSTSGGIQFLGGDNSMDVTQLTDYGFHFDKIPLYCDSKAAIAISCNPVQHSTEYQLADLFTKALPKERFKYLVRRLGMRCLTPEELEVLANESA
nr:hypothetical protein [Tanacetum cinerariifolium]